MKTKICVYCGENEGKKWIPNPNADKNDMWWVCATCQIIIRFQQRMTLLMMLGKETHNRRFLQEAKRIQEEIDAIAKAEGIPVFSCVIEKIDGGGEKAR